MTDRNQIARCLADYLQGIATGTVHDPRETMHHLILQLAVDGLLIAQRSGLAISPDQARVLATLPGGHWDEQLAMFDREEFQR